MYHCIEWCKRHLAVREKQHSSNNLSCDLRDPRVVSNMEAPERLSQRGGAPRQDFSGSLLEDSDARPHLQNPNNKVNHDMAPGITKNLCRCCSELIQLKYLHAQADRAAISNILLKYSTSSLLLMPVCGGRVKTGLCVSRVEVATCQRRWIQLPNNQWEVCSHSLWWW